ncbi:vitamin B12 dependent-methionine synthase activation domain-containing protein [Chloroflexota bacterium]
MEILDSIPVKLDPEEVIKRLRIRKVSRYIERIIQELIELVQPVAKPKAIYELSYVDNKNRDSLYIDGVRFTSRVLRINLDKVGRVFPYIVTCGRELDEIAIQSDDLVKRYYLDAIQEMVLHSGISYLTDYLTENYMLGRVSRMHPGSLKDWPITQQKGLFSIFGNVEDLIGVKLTESFLMIPVKSVSGIYFPTEIKFESCQLCPREVCSGRMAPYDPDLVKKYGEKIIR